MTGGATVIEAMGAGKRAAQAQARAEETAVKNVKLWNYMGLLGGLIIVLALY